MDSDAAAADADDDESVFMRYFLFTRLGVSHVCSGELLKVSDDVGNSTHQRVAF